MVARIAEDGATTHPSIVEGIIEYLLENGFHNISVIESSWVGDSTARAFAQCGYRELSRRTGVPLHDLKSDDCVSVRSGDQNLRICKRAAQADFLINVPVLKAHCQTQFTCALKNLKGIIPDSEKRRYHTLGIHKPVALLNAAIKPHLHVIDALCGDLTFEEGGNPVPMNTLLLGCDPVLLDSYGAALIGLAPHEVPYYNDGPEAWGRPPVHRQRTCRDQPPRTGIQTIFAQPPLFPIAKGCKAGPGLFRLPWRFGSCAQPPGCKGFR